MKNFLWLAAGTLCASSAIAHAQDQGGALLAPVQLELQRAASDDQIIGLAKAAKVNIMADATDEAEDKEGTLTVDKQQTLLEWLRDVSYASKKSWQRDGNSIVMWRAPDATALTRRVVEEARAKAPATLAQAMPALRASLDPELVAYLDANPEVWSRAPDRLYSVVVDDALRSLLKKKYGWDEKNPNFQAQITNENIPDDLRAHILMYRLIVQARPNQSHSPAWLEDDIWKQVRLFVEGSGPGREIINGQVQPRRWNLIVEAPVEGQLQRKGVATLAIEGGGER